MHTNANLIPRCLIHSRQYQKELEVRQVQELEDAEQERVRNNFFYTAPDIEDLMFVARSIAF